MYHIIKLLSYFIRTFLLPNPFSPLGASAEIINIIFGIALVPITYCMVGLNYKKGSEPGFGSFLFLVVYAINSLVTYLVCKAYPNTVLMVVIVIVYLVLYAIISINAQAHSQL